MNRVIIDLEALRDNVATVDRAVRAHGATWSVVTKALSGHEATLKALFAMGVRSVNDTRLQNLEVIARLEPAVERIYLRPPHPSVVDDVVRLCHASLNTDIEVVRQLDAAARRRNCRHGVIPMLELGDLREGITPGELLDFVAVTHELDNIDLAGLGGQIGCLSGLAPSVDQIAQLAMWRELIELKFGIELDVISAGSTIFLPMLFAGSMPPGITHFRIGEGIFLGTNLVNGTQMPELRDDVIRLETEVATVREKSLLPLGEVVESTPFAPMAVDSGRAAVAGQRGDRALLTIGQLDTEVKGLTPERADVQIAGASSDITVVNLEPEAGLGPGDHLRFRTSYSAFVRLMASRFIDRHERPPLGSFIAALDQGAHVDVPPVLGPRAAWRGGDRSSVSSTAPRA